MDNNAILEGLKLKALWMFFLICLLISNNSCDIEDSVFQPQFGGCDRLVGDWCVYVSGSTGSSCFLMASFKTNGDASIPGGEYKYSSDCNSVEFYRRDPFFGGPLGGSGEYVFYSSWYKIVSITNDSLKVQEDQFNSKITTYYKWR
jgi:hypothetical protein